MSGTSLGPNDPQKVPESVAIIMDGNGRWAQQRGRPRMVGHRAGAEAVDRVTESAARLGVKHLTLYAFSTENWQRPEQEVTMLWRLLVRDLKRRGPKCLREGIRLTSIGRTDRMPAKALAELRRVEELTAGGDSMTLCLALDYGGEWDVRTALQRAYEMGQAGSHSKEELAELPLSTFLPSGQVPPVDLLIRTGGESRVSNFLPWQLSYAELLFMSCLWPEFGEEDLLRSFEFFATKQRRFGTIVEPVSRAPVRSHQP